MAKKEPWTAERSMTDALFKHLYPQGLPAGLEGKRTPDGFEITNPFYQALEQIEPDWMESGQRFYSVDRSAALLKVPRNLFRAWAERRYEFATFGGPRDLYGFDHHVLPTKISQEGLAIIKKALDKEPKPFPPLPKEAEFRTSLERKVIKMEKKALRALHRSKGP